MCVCVCVCVCDHPAMSEGALLDLSDVLNTDPHILGTGHTGTHSLSQLTGSITHLMVLVVFLLPFMLILFIERMYSMYRHC